MVWLKRAEDVSKFMSKILAIGFFGAGGFLIIVGSKVNTAIFNYSSFIIPEEFVNTARATILIGVSLLLVISLQFLGSIREWCFFMVLNTALLLYLCTVAYFVIVYSQQDSELLNPQLYYGLHISQKRFGEDSTLGAEFRQGWTFTQHRLHCCGVNNYTDWSGVKMISIGDPQVPTSCCKQQIAFCSDNVDFENATQSEKFIYVEGCYEKAKSDISFIYIWKGLVPIEIVGVLSAFNSAFLAWRWRNSG